MARHEGCLVDVYETLLSCDFVAHRIELPALAGVQIVRGGLDGKVPAAGTTVVRSLPDVEAMLGA